MIPIQESNIKEKIEASNDPISEEASTIKKDNKPSGLNISNFIFKTYTILQETKFQPIISWTQPFTPNTQPHLFPQGSPTFPSKILSQKAISDQISSFKIHNIKAFEETVLPLYFKHSNFTSFVRQLNMYSFHKIRGDKDQYEFQHQLFKKDRLDLLKNIKRKSTQSTAHISSIGFIEAEQIEKQFELKQKKIKKEVNVIQDHLNKSGLFSLQNYDNNQNKNKLEESQQKNDHSAESISQDFNQNFTKKIEKLQEMNKNLKKQKLQKSTLLKTMSQSNKALNAAKFNKIMMVLIASKIKAEKEVEQKSEDQIKNNPTSLNELLEHIVNSSEVQTFREYIKIAGKLFGSDESR